MAYAPPVRGPQTTAPPVGVNPNKSWLPVIDPATGMPVRNGSPVSSPTPAPSSGLPNINGPGYATAPPTRSPDVGYEGPPEQYTPGNPGPGRFERDANGNFLSGDPGAYASWYAGAYPNGPVGSYQDPVSLAAKNAAQNNYGASAANLDLQQNNILSAFNELQGNLNRSKGRSLGSLANSMADRGLTQSGIFLGSTNDVNQNFSDQLAQSARQRDDQFGGVQRERTNISNLLAQALAEADRQAFQRTIDAWNERQRSALERAQATLAALGGG